ncbi:MAG: DUF308 domain-containing protein [Clostridia bacterium]|nr:DUF308 domain-containing protein [Clostridia bacterium]
MPSIPSVKAAKYGTVTISLLLCAVGAIAVAIPTLSISIIGVILGILLIAFGAFKLLGYFSRDLYRLAFQFDLAFGIMLIALSVIVLARPTVRAQFLCVLTGVVVLADGLLKVQTALDARRFGLRHWWVIVPLALLAGAAGIILVVHPADSAEGLQALLGIALMIEGLLNLSVALLAVKVVTNRRADAEIEGE